MVRWIEPAHSIKDFSAQSRRELSLNTLSWIKIEIPTACERDFFMTTHPQP
jgi:hypothetical protein